MLLEVLAVVIYIVPASFYLVIDSLLITPSEVATRSELLTGQNRKPYIVEVENGAQIPARTVVIATGAEYRRPPCKNLSRFEGAGVYYAATFVEAQLCAGEEVIVIGGGNSGGQAAVFLAQMTKRVHLLVRSSSLAKSMSRYLIRRIEES